MSSLLRCCGLLVVAGLQGCGLGSPNETACDALAYCEDFEAEQGLSWQATRSSSGLVGIAANETDGHHLFARSLPERIGEAPLAFAEAQLPGTLGEKLSLSLDLRAQSLPAQGSVLALKLVLNESTPDATMVLIDLGRTGSKLEITRPGSAAPLLTRRFSAAPPAEWTRLQLKLERNSAAEQPAQPEQAGLVEGAELPESAKQGSAPIGSTDRLTLHWGTDQPPVLEEALTLPMEFLAAQRLLLGINSGGEAALSEAEVVMQFDNVELSAH